MKRYQWCYPVSNEPWKFSIVIITEGTEIQLNFFLGSTITRNLTTIFHWHATSFIGNLNNTLYFYSALMYTTTRQDNSADTIISPTQPACEDMEALPFHWSLRTSDNNYSRSEDMLKDDCFDVIFLIQFSVCFLGFWLLLKTR